MLKKCSVKSKFIYYAYLGMSIKCNLKEVKTEKLFFWNKMKINQQLNIEANVNEMTVEWKLINNK